jgi:AcrR family transcriptional regulator
MSKLEGIALELFAERGYREVTVDDIAVVAGSSARTLFRYFPSKEDYLLGYPRRLCAQATADIDALKPSDEPLITIWSFLRQRLIETPPDLDSMTLWRRAADNSPDMIARIRGERFDAIRDAATRYCEASMNVDASIDPQPRLLAGLFAGFDLTLFEAIGRSNSTLTEILAAADQLMTAP